MATPRCAICQELLEKSSKHALSCRGRQNSLFSGFLGLVSTSLQPPLLMVHGVLAISVQGGGGSSATAVGVDYAASSSNTYVGPGYVILQVRHERPCVAWCRITQHRFSASCLCTVSLIPVLKLPRRVKSAEWALPCQTCPLSRMQAGSIV